MGMGGCEQSSTNGSESSKMTVITHQKEGIAGLPAPTLRQEPLFSGLWMLKMQKPGLITGL